MGPGSDNGNFLTIMKKLVSLHYIKVFLKQTQSRLQILKLINFVRGMRQLECANDKAISM